MRHVTSCSISLAPSSTRRRRGCSHATITVGAAAAPIHRPYERRGERLQKAQGGGVELFQAACILLPFDHYIIAAHAAPSVHSWSHSCACAFSSSSTSSSSCRWRVSNQYVAYQPVTVHPTRGNLVLGHLRYEFRPQACQPGGSGGAPHCQLPRYAPPTLFFTF